MTPTARKALRLLQILVALALVAWVCARVSLEDRAERGGGEGKVTEVRSGSAVGQGPGGAILFRDSAGRTEMLEKADGWEVRPGLRTLVRHLRPALYVTALLGAVLAVLMTALRWRLLLEAVGIDVSVASAARLVWVGLFFNLVIPGLTGGDVVRAVLVARGNSRPEAAIVSVLVDRLVGLSALVGVASVAVVVQWTRFPEVAPAVLAVGAGMAAFSGFLLSQGVRRFLRVERILRSLPFGSFLARLDEALLVYRRHPGRLLGAFGLSIGNHVLSVACVLLVGRALGDALAVADYLVLVPVVNILSSVPIAPAGWGVGETLFGEAFSRFGSTFELGVGLSLVLRFTSLLISLPGGLFWVRTDRGRPGDAS